MKSKRSLLITIFFILVAGATGCGLGWSLAKKSAEMQGWQQLRSKEVLFTSRGSSPLVKINQDEDWNRFSIFQDGEPKLKLNISTDKDTVSQLIILSKSSAKIYDLDIDGMTIGEQK